MEEKKHRSLEEEIRCRDEEIHHLREQLAEYEKTLSGDREIIRRIQQELIPGQISGAGIADVYAENRLLGILGGDFYDVIKLPNNSIAFIVADVSGHGIASGLIMAMAKVWFGMYIQNNFLSGEMLSRVNREFWHCLGQLDEYMTVFCGIVDGRNKRLFYTNAGHVPQLIIRSDSTVLHLDSNAKPVGAFKDSVFNTEMISLEKADKLFLYTDGIIEARNPARKFFSLNRLEETIRTKRGLCVSDLCRAVFSEVEAFRDTHPNADDMTILCAEIL